MSKAMRTQSSSSPIHVHVNETTPVHVHVNRSGHTRTAQVKTKGDATKLRPIPSVKTRVPWDPSGNVPLGNMSQQWEGPTQRLEIKPPLHDNEAQHSHSAPRLSELTSEHGQVSQYEKIDSLIDTLITEVSSLKKEVHLLERQSEKLNASQQVIAKQEEELAEVTKELEETERENTRLRQSMEKMLEDIDYTRLETVSPSPDKDALLKKLMEAELDGTAAAMQVSALRESVSKMDCTRANKLSGSEPSVLALRKDLLVQKLDTFEATSRSLRHLLRDCRGSQRVNKSRVSKHLAKVAKAKLKKRSRLRKSSYLPRPVGSRRARQGKMESTRLSELKDTLHSKLSEREAENANLVVELQEKDREILNLSSLLETEKDNSKTSADLTKTLESTRARLQGQLRSKEAENNRLTVQIKNLERSANQQKAERELLSHQLTRLKHQSTFDKAALKRATRAQKQRAERCQDTAGQLSFQLLDMEKQVADALSAAETWQNRHAQELNDKSKLELELSRLNSRVTELTEKLQSTEDEGRAEREALLDRLHGLNKQSAEAKLENQSLKATTSALEEKLALSLSELQEVKASVKQYESLLESYKLQVGKTQAEAEEYRTQLAKVEIEAQAVRAEVDMEIEQVRKDMLGQLAELEPLPEALRYSQVQLKEAQERSQSQERHNVELSAALKELHLKVETQEGQVELLRQKNKMLLEENRKQQHQVENLERKLEAASREKSDLQSVITKRDEMIHANQLRLDEKKRECSSLSRRLEEALDDARQQINETRERAVTKQRSSQAKILDLETQLSRTSSEINQMRRCKDEVERRYQSRLQDLRDRLEQSDGTNRSLQSYVQFLKASYANVFGDPLLSSSMRVT